MIGWIFALGALLVVAAGLAYRRQIEQVKRDGLTEAAIRQIETSGRVDVDDPLDLHEAAEEEERFWEESWDEPEPL